MAGLVDADTVRKEARAVALAVRDLVAGTYGPGGGTVVVEDILLDSGASVLREVPPRNPNLRPYQSLVANVQRLSGDGATGAVLLATHLVERGLELGASRAATHMGLARRQVLGLLASLRVDAKPSGALAWVAPFDAAHVLAGLAALGDHVDLDLVEIRAEAQAGAEWTPGLIVQPMRDVPAPEGRVPLLALHRLEVSKPKTEGTSFRLRPGGMDAAHDEEAARMASVVNHVVRTGARIVLAGGPVDEALAFPLAARGIAVVPNVEKGTLERARRGLGATPVGHAAAAGPEDCGQATVDVRPPRRGGWVLRGEAACTFVVPAMHPLQEQIQKDAAERLLRAAGAVLTEPGALPGGGRWQRDVAAGLRRAADHAPGHAPLVVHMVADAFDALADTLVANTGADPLDVRLLDDGFDPYACVAHGVDAAFSLAESVLRLDGRIDKRPSTPEGLRGGSGPIGSPKGMPGDIPPLM